MTSRQPAFVADGSTHASRVMPVVSCSDAELGMSTRAFVPLNESAPPYFPEAVQVVFTMEPTLPLPEASPSVVPVPSLKPYAATSPLEFGWAVTADVVLENGPKLPAASKARTS